MLRPIARFLAHSLIAILTLTLASCSDRLRPYPVSGKAIYRDKPAEGAIVTFVPLAGSEAAKVRPSGVVQPDGVFRLSTSGAFDGAPAGLYAVTILFPSPEKKIDDQNAGPDLLQGKYAKADVTPLRAEVKSGDNELEPYSLK